METRRRFLRKVTPQEKGEIQTLATNRSRRIYNDSCNCNCNLRRENKTSDFFPDALLARCV